MKAPLYLLDGYSLIYRSYFAFLRSPLRNTQGKNTSAVFGFFRALFGFLQTKHPSYFAIVQDSKTPTFRHQLYSEYKATRQKTPEDLHAQIPVIEEIASALGFPLLRIDGMEADDVMATLARRCRDEDRACYILSGDKDLLQMVEGGVKVLRPEKGNFVELGREEVFKAWAVYPEQIVDYLSLVGDAADNVPGAKGIGEKTAAALLGEYGTLENLYAKIDTVKSASQRTKLLESRGNVLLSKSLVVLRADLDLPIASLDELSLRNLHGDAAVKLFQREGIKSLADELLSGKAGLPLTSAGGGEFDFEGPSPAKASAGPVPEAEQGPAAGPSEKDAPVRTKNNRPGSYETVTSLEALESWIRKVKKAGRAAFDTETTDIDPFRAELVGFSLAVEAEKACYVPVKAPWGEGLGLTAVLPFLKALLEDPAVEIIGQNIKFDYKIMRRLGISIKNPAFDTMLAAWLVNADSGIYNMDRLAEEYLDYKTLHYDEVVGKGETFDLVPVDKATRYAAEDADVTYRLYETFAPILKERGLIPLFRDVEMPLVKILGDMELEGIRLDPGVLETYGVELDRELLTIQSEIFRLCGKEFNINSTKQLQEILFVDRKLSPSKKTKTGFSTDTSVLEELAAEDPVPERILRHRTLSKLKSTYVETLPKLVSPKTGRLHTNFHQTGTATGRLSSKDPNLQNIPIKAEEGRKIRSAFIPEKGKLFLSADYAQIELVVLAHLSGDPGLGSAFTSGVDVHRRTGALIFGIDEKDVSPEQRRIAKTINFGVMYGMSAFRLARELGIPRSDAGKFIDFYFRQYPKIRDFVDLTVKEAEKTGRVKTLLGRERPIPAITSRNKTEKMGAERIAVNTPIQGSAADIVKLAMIKLDGRIRREGLASRLILQVHDELIFEVPTAEAEIMKALVKEEMERAVTLSVPLKVSVETGLSWGDLH